MVLEEATKLPVTEPSLSIHVGAVDRNLCNDEILYLLSSWDDGGSWSARSFGETVNLLTTDLCAAEIQVSMDLGTTCSRQNMLCSADS